MTDESIRGEIEALERRRCEALTACDITVLGSLMAEDLVHIHGNGHIDDKAGYLKGVQEKYRFHRIVRGDLRIRTYGDLAIVNGTLEQTVSVTGVDKPNEICAFATQTWVLGETGWKQNTCHMAFLSVA